MTVVNTLLLSAGVSAAVALGVEYLAKPGLEARKERILVSRRDAISARQALRLCESKLEAYVELHGFDSPGIDEQIRIAGGSLAEAMSALELAMSEPHIHMSGVAIRALTVVHRNGVQWGYRHTAGVEDAELYRTATDILMPLCAVADDALSHKLLTPRERRNIVADLREITQLGRDQALAAFVDGADGTAP